MAGGTRSGGPQEFAVFRGDRHVVDACFPAAHQSIAIEFPLLVAVRAKPIAGIIAPLILEANTDAVFIERPMNWTPWDHGGFDLRCTLACPCPSKIKPLLAASACAVGMWATRLRCPSEAAYPQLFAPPRFSCARNPAVPKTSPSWRLSEDQSQIVVPPRDGLAPQSEPHSEPVHIAPRPSSPALCQSNAKGYLLPDFYSGCATGIPGRFSDGL